MKQQDIEDLRQLIEFLKQHGVAEFDVDRGDLKIRLKFNPQESGPAGLSDLARLLQSAPQAAAQAAAAPAATVWRCSRCGAGCDADAGLHMVKSPIVGRFMARRLPAPRRLFLRAITWKRAR